MSDLLPCPFCGGAPRVVSGGPGCTYVLCSVCNAAADDGSAEYAARQWNKRAAPAPAGEPVAWIIERHPGVSGFGRPKYVLLHKDPYDPTDDAFWLQGARDKHTITPLYPHPAPSARDEALEALEAIAATDVNRPDVTAHTMLAGVVGRAKAAIRSLKGGGNGK